MATSSAATTLAPVESARRCAPPSVRGKRLPQPAPRPCGWRSSTPTAASSASSPSASARSAGARRCSAARRRRRSSRAMRQHAIVIDPRCSARRRGPISAASARISTAQVVVVCTGPTSVAQRVRGLRLGADDWVTKPCHPEEVLARVEAAVRARQAGASVTEPPSRSSPASSRSGRTCSRPSSAGGRSGSPGASSSCSSCCPRPQGRVIPRERIYERVWGYAMAHGDRSVDVFVRKLRKKLEAASPGWRLPAHPLRRRLPVRRPGGRRSDGRRRRRSRSRLRPLLACPDA